MTEILQVLTLQITRSIYSEEDEKKQGKTPKRRTSIAKERQGNAYDRSEPQHHAHIDEHMKEENTEHGIAIDTPKTEGLTLCQGDKSQYQRKEE